MAETRNPCQEPEEMSAKPWFPFYPADWRADPALRICSAGARLLWLEMLCLMHEAEPRGHLLVNGKRLSARQLSALVGLVDAEVGPWLVELEEAGVFSRTDDGTPYSRKMVRDTEKSEIQRHNVSQRPDRNGVGRGVGSTNGSTKPPTDPLPHIPEPKLEAVRTSLTAIDRLKFDDFWAAYPLKVAKKTAEAAFAKALKRATHDEIMAGLERAKDGRLFVEGFAAHPTTWLNQDRWNDDVEPPRPPRPTTAAPNGGQSRTDASRRGAARAIARRRAENPGGHEGLLGR